MLWLNRLVAVFVALLILTVLPLALWVFNLRRLALDPQTYITALNSEHFYDNLVPDILLSAPNTSDPNTMIIKSVLNSATPQEIVEVSNRLLPPNWLKKQIEDNINRFFDWLPDSNSPIPKIGFDLAELKKQLADPVNEQKIVEIVLPKLPACKPAEETIIQVYAAGDTKGTFPLCKPSSALLQASNTVLVSGLKSIGKNLPNNWTLDQIMQDSSFSLPTRTPGGDRPIFNFSQLRSGITLLSRLAILPVMLSIMLFSLIVIVVIRSSRAFFRWTGWLLLLGGLIALIPVFLLPFRLVSQIGVSNVGDVSAPVIGLFTGMANSIDAQLTLSVLAVAGGVIVAGLIAFLLSILLPVPEPAVEKWQVMLEQSGMIPMMTPLQPPAK